MKYRVSILIAQTIFATLGLFFMAIGLYGQATFRPSIWYEGPQPIILLVVGLPLLAIALVLTVLHKRK